MKKLIAFMGLIGLFQRAKAQTFAEWFEQNKTELKYLRAQLVALEEDDALVEEGFAVDETGLTRISTDKMTDLGLHEQHLQRLTHVNTQLLNDPRVDGIITLTTETGKVLDLAQEIVDSSPAIRDGFDGVVENISGRYTGDLLELFDILEDEELQLDDSTRLHRLRGLYEETKNLNDLAWQVWRNARYYSKLAGL
jgi:hypothetical protein